MKRWISSDGDPTHATPTATYFYYDGWNLIQETGLTARTYVHGARVDEIVASAPATGGWLYHYYDARGNCIMLTDASGGLQEVYEYDAFGQPYVYTGNGNLVARKFGSPAGNRFLFTGREWLKDMRVYDFRARLYQPELGRFLQPDPKQFAAGDYNLYRYCHNDPVNRNDPTGLFSPNVTTWNRLMWMQSGSSFSSREFDLIRQGQAYIASPTGNYKEPLKNHVAKNGETKNNPGLTVYKLGDPTEENGKLIFKNPTLNWWVLEKYLHTDVVTRELQHVNRYLWFQSPHGDGTVKARTLNNRGTSREDFKAIMENTSLEEWIWQDNNIHGKPNKHALKNFPEKHVAPDILEDQIKNVAPNEDP